MKKLEKLKPVTLQEQLYNELLNAIRNGTYKPGDKIPTEFELSDMYQVSRVTVRAAIQQLVNRNELIRKAGKGTFVKQHLHTEVLHKGGSFTENCLQRNAKPSTRVVGSRIIANDLEFLKDLKTADGKVLEVTRIRLVDDEPCIVEVDYFPTSYDFVLAEENRSTSFLALITKKTGIAAEQFIDQFTIATAGREYAGYLECAPRTPLLKVTQSVKTRDDRIIYINEQYILTSKYIYVKS